MSGTVISWFDEKAFGFIKPKRGGEDIFAHISGLKDGEALKEGSTVEFDENYDYSREKYRAENITGCILVFTVHEELVVVRGGPWETGGGPILSFG